MKTQFSELYSGSARSELETRLASYVQGRRWFRSKTRAVAGATLEHALPIPIEGVDVILGVVRIRFLHGDAEDYAVPLTWVRGDSGAHLALTRPHLVVASVEVEGEERPRWLCDALGERRALEGFLALVARGAVVRGEDCTLTIRAVGQGLGVSSAAPRPVETEQSNTSVVYGEDCILKIVRKLEAGRAPDLEMSEFLTRAGYGNTPRLLAAIELERADGQPATVGLVHEFVSNTGDAWGFALAIIGRGGASPDGEGEALERERSAALVRTLASRIAQMHTALASRTLDPAFASEPIDLREREALGRDVGRALDALWNLVDERAAAIPSETVERLLALRSREGEIRACITRFVDTTHPCVKTRVHGDLHLGQVLVRGDDFVLIDFEGEPARSLEERKAKRSPAVDVAGMLRSLHYVSVAAWRGAPRATQSTMRAAAEKWHRDARREFLNAYFDSASAGSVLPEDAEAREVLLKFYLLEKCVYELHYEMNNRPDWVAIPALGLESLFEGDDAP